MTDAELIPMAEQIKCVVREVGKRVEFYPRWIDAGRMTKQQADREIALMRAVLATLRRVDAAERLL
jgi:hypothetical protein